MLQAMSHVEGLRNFFLNEDNYKDIKRPPGDISFQLVTRLGGGEGSLNPTLCDDRLQFTIYFDEWFRDV